MLTVTVGSTVLMLSTCIRRIAHPLNTRLSLRARSARPSQLKTNARCACEIPSGERAKNLKRRRFVRVEGVLTSARRGGNTDIVAWQSRMIWGPVQNDDFLLFFVIEFR